MLLQLKYSNLLPKNPLKSPVISLIFQLPNNRQNPNRNPSSSPLFFFNFPGAICGGNCCNNATELELRDKAAGMFEQLLHHHTSSLRGVLETNAKQFQSEYPSFWGTAERISGYGRVKSKRARMPFYANHWAKSRKSLLGVRPKYIFVAINNLSYANSSGSAQKL